MLLRVGHRLYGFCGGAFGRDSYEDSTVEAVGADWVVARDARGVVQFYAGDPERLLEYTDPKLSTWGALD